GAPRLHRRNSAPPVRAARRSGAGDVVVQGTFSRRRGPGPLGTGCRAFQQRGALMAGPLRTYSHLADLPRKPSRYDVATTALHYRVSHPSSEVDVPIAAWYRQYQQGSPLQSTLSQTFADPRPTDYTA